MSAHTSSPARTAPDAPEMPEPRIREFPARSVSGGLALLGGLVGLLAGVVLLAAAANTIETGAKAGLILAGVLVLVASLIATRG